MTTKIQTGNLDDAAVTPVKADLSQSWAFTAVPSSTVGPSAANDLVRKSYADALSGGLDPKDSVRAISTSNITLSGPQTIDGVSIIAGNRVLVAGQTLGQNNGIYVCAAGAWARSDDANTSVKVTAGMYCFVTEGTSYDNTGWVLTTNDPIILGTTPLAFSQFLGASVSPASETVAGIAELATQAETNTGTDDARIVTPLKMANATTVVHPARTLTAGAGLTGGGDLSADRTFNAVAHADGSIVVNADDIQVGVLATDVQHGNRGGGTLHAAATTSAQGFIELADQTEVNTGTDTTRAVTPATLAAAMTVIHPSNLATETAAGIAEVATLAETNTGSDDARIVTPLKLETSKYLDQDGSKLFGTATGTNTYAVTLSPAPTAYAAGNAYCVLFTNGNTGPATLNVNGLGAKTIVKNTATALASGDIPAGRVMALVYDGTNFQLVGAVSAGSGSSNPWTVVDFSGSPASFQLNVTGLSGTLEVQMGVRCTSAFTVNDLHMVFNGDTGATYSGGYNEIAGTARGAFWAINGSSSPAGGVANNNFIMPKIQGTNNVKMAFGDKSDFRTVGGFEMGDCLWVRTVAGGGHTLVERIDTIDIYPPSGLWDPISFCRYRVVPDS